MAAILRPRLRSIETIFVPDRTLGRALMLRDGEGIAPGPVVVAAELAAVIGRMNGARTAAEIAAEASRALGKPVEELLVARLAEELDQAGMLDTPSFRQKKREVVEAFARAPSRPASHAGGAYHDDAVRLTRFIDDECLGRAPVRPPPGELRGLCAPHMDLWRAAVGYGHAYRALGGALSASVDTLILLGTSHMPMRRPFAVCDKTFETPLGPLHPDRPAIADLARASRFDVREDEYLHKGEHSLEFQAVFLRHALARRPAEAPEPKIIPVLCGLGDAPASGRDPAEDSDAASFLDALRDLCERLGGRALVVAGADLAHVGPRFGDRRPLDDAGRRRLAERDAESIALALDGDAPAFFEHVQSDLDTRRVCGLGPIYTMLRVLSAARGERLHYAQHVDPEEGSIVSHASLGFYAA